MCPIQRLKIFGNYALDDAGGRFYFSWSWSCNGPLETRGYISNNGLAQYQRLTHTMKRQRDVGFRALNTDALFRQHVFYRGETKYLPPFPCTLDGDHLSRYR